jgi:hypothetical protein
MTTPSTNSVITLGDDKRRRAQLNALLRQLRDQVDPNLPNQQQLEILSKIVVLGRLLLTGRVVLFELIWEAPGRYGEPDDVEVFCNAFEAISEYARNGVDIEVGAGPPDSEIPPI